MANSLAKDPTWNTGEVLTSAQMTVIDQGQYEALCRTGTTPLLGDAVIDTDAYDLTLLVGAAKTLTLNSGSGYISVTTPTNFRFNANFPAVNPNRTIIDYACPCSPRFDQTLFSPGFPSVATALVNTSARLTFELTLPRGFTLDSLKLPVRGATSGVLPGTMPVVTLKRYTISAYGTPTETVGSATDTSASNAVYVADHLITISGLTHVVVEGSRYVLDVTIGTGGGADVGMIIYAPHITGSVTSLRQC